MSRNGRGLKEYPVPATVRWASNGLHTWKQGTEQSICGGRVQKGQSTNRHHAGEEGDGASSTACIPDAMDSGASAANVGWNAAPGSRGNGYYAASILPPWHGHKEWDEASNGIPPPIAALVHRQYGTSSPGQKGAPHRPGGMRSRQSTPSLTVMVQGRW